MRLEELQTCPYCEGLVKLVTGKEIYRGRFPEKKFYLCEPCDAYVGCHGDTDRAMGTVANKKLRDLRKMAHSEFDIIWRAGSMGRSAAYEWLANRLSISKKKCHIGMMNENQCKKVIIACKHRRK